MNLSAPTGGGRQGRRWALALCLLLGGMARSGDGASNAAPDLVVADFESDTYGAWQVTGTAFGGGPATGALPGQMPVRGFLGRRLANSFVGGDDATGTLTSPPFRIERPFLNLLVGGGGYAGETGVELWVDGARVRSVTGPNTRPGGSEQLDWKTWEVREFLGREARIRIVDQRQGGWGHINVDQIVQSVHRREAAPVQRVFAITHRYLWLPVKRGAPRRRMRFWVGGRIAREFEIEYATGERDFEVFADVSAFKGRELTVRTILPGGPGALGGIRASDELPGAATLYQESLRPRYHFTVRRGWHNDPNGLVYFAGEYHLYFQHNPYGIEWGNMHWGHAVSPDLVHWRELPIAIYPPRFGDWAFSGSAAVDWKNTSGFGNGDEPPLIAAWTSTGRGEVISYSLDRGRTFQEYEGNPVVKHRGRDPMIFWHPATRRWVMALYDEYQGGRYIAFYTSPDLKEWTFRDRLAGYYECPNLFELPVAGRAGESRWIVFGGDGRYAIGRFDGTSFRTESGPHQLWHGNFYASQTYSDASNRRRIQIGWARGITFPGMPFSQQMTVPVELKLRETPAGLRMFGQPVPELEGLRRNRREWPEMAVADEARLLAGVRVDATRLRAVVEAGAARRVGFRIRGQEVAWDPAARRVSCGDLSAPLEFSDQVLKFDILVDRGSIEVFVNGGQVALSKGIRFAPAARSLEVFSSGGRAVMRRIVVDDLASIWPAPQADEAFSRGGEDAGRR